MANETKDQQNTNTADARSGENHENEGIDVGYGKDTGEQRSNAATAGGREGTFSIEDENELPEIEKAWSPGGDQPKS